jgi:cytochrome c-type biogenesis protein
MNQVQVSPVDNKSTLNINRLNVMMHAFLFVFGFSIVFTIGWGGATTLLGRVFYDYKDWIARIGGIIVILFGLASMDVIRIPWFYMDTRPEFQSKGNSWVSSLLMGLFFAAGWSPCIGATLGAILTLGFSQNTVNQAMILAFVYSLGLGIPFLILAFGINGATSFVRRMGPHLRKFQIISGVFIILIGLLLLTNQLTLIAIWATQNGLYLEITESYAAVPSALAALSAGVLSFVSPCVLPLVPAYLGYLSGRALGGASQ